MLNLWPGNKFHFRTLTKTVFFRSTDKNERCENQLLRIEKSIFVRKRLESRKMHFLVHRKMLRSRKLWSSGSDSQNSSNITEKFGIWGCGEMIYGSGWSEIGSGEVNLIFDEMRKFKNHKFVMKITDRTVFGVRVQKPGVNSEKLISWSKFLCCERNFCNLLENQKWDHRKKNPVAYFVRRFQNGVQKLKIDVSRPRTRFSIDLQWQQPENQKIVSAAMKIEDCIFENKKHVENVVWKQQCIPEIWKDHDFGGLRAWSNRGTRCVSKNCICRAFQIRNLKYLWFPILCYATRPTKTQFPGNWERHSESEYEFWKIAFTDQFCKSKNWKFDCQMSVFWQNQKIVRPTRKSIFWKSRDADFWKNR